ncbi:ModE molybdate transport repressor domain-containing protein [Cryobacterium flavum]|uniref:LysR family transcriptional regulator n=2 Tax=Cryobacterium flavum TaxID=1424659 RepID=A0A4R8V1D6_9MICO|nr:LysR family transcriptional regulator [Cryobacterium flavum]SDO04143.1 ModE molybdate transport repressor domain-containing protein [Cryobacterium flavum]
MIERMIHLPGESPDLDANALRVVRAVHETGSITAAAVALGYSQPAVSQQLKRLEQRLGLSVVERVGRGVRLTEAGLVLARHAVTVATALDAAAGEIAELQGLRAGLVRLVAFPSASATLVPSLLARMKARHSQISVTYLEAEPPEAVAAVRENRADLAITFSYPGDRVDPHRDSAQGLRVATLRRDEMMLVLPVGHPLDSVTPIDLGELADENWVAGCPRCRGHLLDLCDRRGFAPRISYETDNVAAVFGLVEAGIGVALLPALAIESVGRRAGVSIRATTGRDHRTLHAVTAARAERVPALAAVLRVLDAISLVGR